MAHLAPSSYEQPKHLSREQQAVKNNRKKSVVDESMLKAFAKGQLDEATENKVVAFLEKKPELDAIGIAFWRRSAEKKLASEIFE